MSDPKRLLAHIALAGLVLVLLVTTSSAYLRLTAAGLGCADWPACYGRPLAVEPARSAHSEAAPAAAAETDAAGEGARPATAARLLHRISASAAGAAVLAIALIAFANRRELRHELGVALVLLVLTLGLALLGRATPGAQSPAVPVGNLLGGMLMAGLLGWLALGGRREARHPEATAPGTTGQPQTRRGPGAGTWLSAFALAALAAELALGAMTSATYSSLACSTLPDCDDRWWPANWSAADFDMLLPYSQRAGASVALHLAHRYAALVVAAATVAVAARLWRHAPGLAGTLAGLLALQFALGVCAVWLGLPLAVTLLHNVTAALLLLALVAAHRTLLASRVRVAE